MYNKIIVALGLSHGHGFAALEVARRMKAEAGTIIALHVLEPVPGFASNFLPDEYKSQRRETAETAIRERVGKQADAKVVVLSGYPGAKITEYAEEVGADCIIVGSHRPGMKDFFLGSTAARIVR